MRGTANLALKCRTQMSEYQEVPMNSDSLKGSLQKAGGHVEEAAGALVGDHNLKEAGREDQIKGAAREAWGNVKDAGDALIDRAKAAKFDAEAKSDRAEAFDREHSVTRDRI
jgi:uncharacterized protein YjbJ (UPF0337 family)